MAGGRIPRLTEACGFLVAGARRAGYSSPQLATIAGVRQVLLFDAEGLGSYEPTTGAELWFHEWKQDPPVNVAQPLVFDDGRVFISSGYGHGSAMLKVTLTDGKWDATEELWTSNRLKSKFSNPVAHNGFKVSGIGFQPVHFAGGACE